MCEKNVSVDCAVFIYLINSSVIGFENAPNSLTCVTIRKNNILNLKKIYRKKKKKKAKMQKKENAKNEIKNAK